MTSALGREVARGEPPAGAALAPEGALAARLGAGRGVVREAVRTLAAKGMLLPRPRHGTRVRPREEWSLLDREVLDWLLAGRDDPALLDALAEARLVIEPEAAALAAGRGTPEGRARVAAALALMLDGSRPFRARAEADVAFHLALLEATGNPVLRSLRGGLRAVLEAVFEAAMHHPDWFEANLANHAAVGRAVAAGDPEGARAAMRAVLALTRGRLAARADDAPGREEP